MSTVLWANVLEQGKVVSEEADHDALYRHGKQLDALSRKLGLPSFLGLCDTTDARFNTEDLELPPGMTSTDELMAREGAWLDIREAVAMLDALLAHIRDRKVRFGLLRNQHQEVADQLAEAAEFARARAATADKFNFSVVL